MEDFAYTMAYKAFGDRIPFRLDVTPNLISYATVLDARTTFSYCFHSGIVCGLYQIRRLLIYFSNKVGLVAVSVKAIQVDGDVQVDYIALLKWSCIGNTMANDFVHASAETPWESMVVEWTWIGIVTNDEVMDNFVYFLSGDSWLNRSMTNI